MALTPEEREELAALRAKVDKISAATQRQAPEADPGIEPALPPQASAMAQGATWNLSDEAEGIIRALTNPGEFGENYPMYRDAARKQLRRYGEEAPLSKMGYELLGAAPSVLLTGGASAIPRLAPASLKKLIGESAKTGAVQGAASGYGESEGGTGSHAVGTVGGGVLGGAIGAAAPAAIAATGTAARSAGRFLGLDKLLPKLTGSGPSAARNKMLEALEQDLSNPKAMEDLLNKLRGPTGLPEKPLTLLDATVGRSGTAGLPNLQGLAEASMTVPGEGKAKAAKLLNRRNEDQASRIAGDLDLVSTEKEFGKTLRAIEKSAGAQSHPYYAQAFKVGEIHDPEIMRMISERPSLSAAFDDAIGRARDRGEIEATTGRATLLAPTVKMLHHTKMVLDDMIGAAIAKNERGRASELIELKKDLVSKIEEHAPSYRTARELFAGQKGLQNALELGRNFLKEDSWVSRELLGDMTQAEQEMFRFGAKQAFSDRIASSNKGSDIAKAIQSQKRGFEEKLEALFPKGSSIPKTVNERLDLEREMYDVGSKISANSPTARRAAAVEALQDDTPTAGKLISGGVREYLFDLLDKVGGQRLRSARGMTPSVTDEIMTKMTETNPSEIRKIVQELEKQAAENDATAVRRLKIYRDYVAPVLGRVTGEVVAPDEYEYEEGGYVEEIGSLARSFL